MKAGIIGGGLMGICIGYFLAQKGIEVEIFEGAPTLGGLAGSMELPDGTRVDRFYHAILSSDSHLRGLCEELGIADQLRFHETRMGFFYKSKIYSMNNVIEFLKFPPLGWIDRFRLGLTVVAAQFIRDWHKLESISVEKWLLRWGGKQTYQNIWLPMLKAKFDGSFDQTPATYIWARLVRMKSTRSGANQKEEAGHLIGGYDTLVQAMAKQIIKTNGKIHLHTRISKIVIEQEKVTGINVDGVDHLFDVVVSTVQPPLIQSLIPDVNKEYRDLLAQMPYLGILCPLMVLDRPLTGYWTLNLTDDDIPFTGVIETTSYIDPKYVGMHHLVYLPKYTAAHSRYQGMSNAEVEELWLSTLEKMFPDFRRNWVRYFLVNRGGLVEPLHVLNGTHLIPSISAGVENLFIATNSQIYPALTNGESISRKAREIADLITKDL
ncbi:MAG: NAD(P)/FAD-dependent oxidoreductase [Anaerolineaceae bacterium]|nr:NAD(P)/FAD-dependent oxidoreductase [Anaerolineaceae bacterium]